MYFVKSFINCLIEDMNFSLCLNVHIFIRIDFIVFVYVI